MTIVSTKADRGRDLRLHKFIFITVFANLPKLEPKFVLEFNEVPRVGKFSTDQSMHIIGTNIGGASSKVAVMDERGEFCELFLLPSGFSAVKVARQIKQILEQKGYVEGFVTATGYGRFSVEYAQLSISEILCHGLGARFLFRQNYTVGGVGGQDTKAIKTLNGKPADFIINDKCSAGTGKFLEISADRPGLELSEIYKTARKNLVIKISSTCTVFAESGIVSLSANRRRSGRKYRRALP